MIKQKAILPVFLFALLIVLNGCSERKTFSGGSEETLLSSEEAFVSDKLETSEPVYDRLQTAGIHPLHRRAPEKPPKRRADRVRR